MSRVGRDVPTNQKSTPEIILEQRLDHALQVLQNASKHLSKHAEELISESQILDPLYRRGCDLHGVHVALQMAHEQISRPLMDGSVNHGG